MTREGRPPASAHPLFAWMVAEGTNQELLGAELGVSRQALSHFTTGRRAISRVLADRIAERTRGKVPWQSWPLVRGKAGWFHFGVLVPRGEVRDLRVRLDPPSLARLLDPGLPRPGE